jgi:4-amino-4-deoxy-L-arabinose transferase-like glycosyltransferase
MSTAAGTAPARRPELAPAGVVLALGVAAVLLRPALPIDETRYLEILRESIGHDPLLLRLGGELYADKPPLLFWLARGLGACGAPPELALRLAPAISSAGTVAIVARLGRRLDAGLAGWFQAALLLPLAYAQYLLFDPLLTLGIWYSACAWSLGRDGRAALGAACALLTKGPVALLFLAPLFWAFAPLRPREASPALRALAVLGLSLAPLVLWALAAGALGGPAFRNELLWGRWGERLQHSPAHPRSFLFYLPVVALGSIPGTPLLFLPARDPAPGLALRRLRRAVLGILVVFSLISGKQPHYLLPAAPGISLLCAWKQEHVPAARAWLRRMALAACSAVALAGVGAGLWGEELLARIASEYSLPEAASSWPVLFGLPILVGVCSVLLLAKRRRDGRSALVAACLSSASLCVPLHVCAGHLCYPWAIERALRAVPEAPVATLGGGKHGLYRWLARRDHVDELSRTSILPLWASTHTGGLVIVREDCYPRLAAEGWTLVAEQSLRGETVRVLRAACAGAESGERALP